MVIKAEATGDYEVTCTLKTANSSFLTALTDAGNAIVPKEEDISVFSRAAKHGMLGVDGAGAERRDGVHVDHLREVFVIPDGDLLDLVRGTEAVKEVEERDSPLDGSAFCYRKLLSSYGMGNRQGK